MRQLPAFLVASLLAVTLLPGVARPELILSELCDPQNNYTTDRFIEIYNVGPDAMDLSGWTVVAIANSSDVTTWTLSGTILAGQAKVCGNNTTVAPFTVDFPNAQWGASGYFNWNGKIGDGAKLMNGATIVDKIVATGTLFENEDLVRNANITTPNPNSTPSEWTATPVLLATNASPGTHNGSPPPPTGPTISNVLTIPASPAAGDPVDVQADVVDGVNAITAVTLSWGTSAAALVNTIGMPLLGGDTFHTSAPIPGQGGGATIYYRVQAQTDVSSSQTSTRSYTLPGGGGGVPPTVLAVGEMSDSTFLVTFNEPVEPVSAETPGNYTIGALVAVAAVRDPSQNAQVLITVPGVPAGSRTLTVNAVADNTGGQVAYGATCTFNYVDVTIPAGYYDGTAGLSGSALRVALHNIIKGHTAVSYSGVLTAFQTTDVKYNGKVWDPYSDIPGGTPPYEYSFGQTGQGATEGLGYNREHSWPDSWFNGASPMHSDVWILYPTDAKVNGYRGNFPYGNVANPTTTSLNGSKVGPSASAGYSGTVFEPIDPFKGDLARSQFYVATRYFNEDAAWDTTGGAAIRSQLLPWAAQQYMAWSNADPVSWKERMRNGAIYLIQHNRNPFVDHPEFVALIYDTANVTTVDAGARREIALRQNRPNPFSGRTTITFDLARRENVVLRVFDVEGRLVRTLLDGSLEAGSHPVEWDGRDANGVPAGAGLFFCRLDAGGARFTQRMARVR